MNRPFFEDILEQMEGGALVLDLDLENRDTAVLSELIESCPVPRTRGVHVYTAYELTVTDAAAPDV